MLYLDIQSALCSWLRRQNRPFLSSNIIETRQGVTADPKKSKRIRTQGLLFHIRLTWREGKKRRVNPSGTPCKGGAEQLHAARCIVYALADMVTWKKMYCKGDRNVDLAYQRDPRVHELRKTVEPFITCMKMGLNARRTRKTSSAFSGTHYQHRRLKESVRRCIGVGFRSARRRLEKWKTAEIDHVSRCCLTT